MKDKGFNLTTIILVVALVGAAFFVGKYSERSNTPTKEVGEEGVTQGEQERQEEQIILGEEEMKLIAQGGAAAKGNKDAPITIVEFSEYECPFCKSYVDDTYKKIMDEYGDKIYYVFRDYPLPFHSHAQNLAEAARCAGDQDKYWSMHDLLFAKRDEWVEKKDITNSLAVYAKELGLNTQKFNSCLSSNKYTQAVKDDLALGEKVGVGGTPSFFINGFMLVGAQPFENFKTVINEQLNQ